MTRPGLQTTLSRHNGQGQRYLQEKETSSGQAVWLYGQDGHNVLSEVRRSLSA